MDVVAPVTVTEEDVTWFRRARAVWASGESGAPGIVPEGEQSLAYQTTMLPYLPALSSNPAARRLEPILTAAFLHARFAPGRYDLDPPVRPEEAPDDRPLPAALDVTPAHIALLQGSAWAASFMDDKRPYGGSCYYEADIARILGVAVPVDATGQDQFPEADELRFQALHGEMLLVVQAYIQHAAFQPGRYDLPRDGWRAPIRPRCVAMPAAQAAAYQAFCAASPVPDPHQSDRRAPLDHAVRHFAAKAALFSA